MQSEKKYWENFLNADDADAFVMPAEYINMQDFRFGTTSDKGFAKLLESVGSTLLIPNPALPAGQNYSLGQAKDIPNRRTVFFVWNSLGNHGIYCYDGILQRIDPVLLNSQLTGGLNFDKYHLIHSARVENNCVYWTDNYNEPRRLNIDAGIEMNFDPNNPPRGYVPAGAVPTTLVGTRRFPNLGDLLSTTYYLPMYPVPSYESGRLTANFIRTGTGGPNAGPTAIELITAQFSAALWAQLPAKSYTQIVVDAWTAVLEEFAPQEPPLEAPWVIFGDPSLNAPCGIILNELWDWGLDAQFAPTVSLDMVFNNFVRTDGQTIVPYNAPLDEANIAWIRRQPGLPPSQIKILENPLPATNFIKDEAFEFAYRYQYQNFEYSTLSGLSTLADFDEQNAPPTITNLNIENTSIVTSGYLATNFILPTSPVPAYGPNILAKITRSGTGGDNAAPIDIPIPLDWTGYPLNKTYTTVIVQGVNNYFRNLPNAGNSGALTTDIFTITQSVQQFGNYFLSSRDGVHPTLNIKQTWDWGIGDPLFPPTTEANLTLYVATPAPSKQFNRIDVAIPFAETIDQDVIQVDLVANYLVSGIYFIIKSWKTSILADVNSIAAHNNGTAQLLYNFYNDQVGIALDATYAVKPYDSVPLLVQTIETATNRGFMGNFVIGYNSSSLITSLQAAFALNTIGTSPPIPIIGEWFFLLYVSPATRRSASRYMLQTTVPVTPQPPAAYYYYTYNNAQPPFPQSISTGLIFLGNTVAQAIQSFIQIDGNTRAAGTYVALLFVDQDTSSALLSSNLTLDFGVQSKAFKANASYQLAITFYDNYGRKCGIITNDQLQLTTPNTGFSQNKFATGLTWTLSNTNAQLEIPAWAYYYSINVTKCLRTRFFVESLGFVVYATQDADNNYSFTTFVYSQDLAGVAIDLSFLVSNGLGYVFTVGDVVDFYLSGTYYSLSVIAQAGKYIIMDLADVGRLGSGSLAQYEIYTPYHQQTNEPYFEVGQIYLIISPGTSTRMYSNFTGTISGDVFLFQLQNGSIPFISEAMSPNTKHYTLWFTDSGRPNFPDPIGQVTRKSSIAYSNTFIAGAQNNGLSTFDALDTTDISPDFGGIQKLQLASKVQKIGTTMLAICDGSATASLYLGENTLISNTGEVVVAQANSVIGSIHELQGEYGTVNPESVIELRGHIYWFDLQNGKIIQYADNGLFAISNYKMSRFWKLFSDQFRSMTPAQIEALGGRPFVFGGADPHHGELLFTVPSTLPTPPNGFLPDYPEQPYPFDIWDGQGKTIVYKLYADPNKWQGSYSFQPEGLFYLENNLLAFKNGNLYLHNQSSSYCNYYGMQYQPSAMFLFNQQLNKPKLPQNLAVEGSAAPSLVYLMSLYPYLQATDIISDEFKNLEGIFYAPIRRNKLDPAFNNNYPAALVAGEKMRTAILYAWLQWSATQGIVQIKFANCGYILSLGQKV